MANATCTSATSAHRRRLLISLAVTGCFADPPDVGDGDDESGTSTSSPAVESSTSDTGSSASTDDVSTSSTSTSGTDATADASSTSSSTGDAPVCECPSTAVLCESFEDDFAFVDPWGTNAVGAADPTTTTRFAVCGDAAVVVHPDASTLAPHLPMGAFRGGALFEGDCAIAIDDVWLLDGGA